MPAIGDELLGALDDEILAVGIQAGLRQIEMRTGALLGQRQGGDMPARGNFLQVVLALMVGGLGGDHRSGHAVHAIAQGRGRTGTGNGFGEHAQAQQPLTQPALIHRNRRPSRPASASARMEWAGQRHSASTSAARGAMTFSARSVAMLCNSTS